MKILLWTEYCKYNPQIFYVFKNFYEFLRLILFYKIIDRII